jgi:hypothetical protein
MNRALFSALTAICLVLFLSANALDYICADKSDLISFLDQSEEDCEENEKTDNNNQSSEAQQDEAIPCFAAGSLLTLNPTSGLIKTLSLRISGHHFLEINSPPPQF